MLIICSPRRKISYFGEIASRVCVFATGLFSFNRFVGAGHRNEKIHSGLFFLWVQLLCN